MTRDRRHLITGTVFFGLLVLTLGVVLTLGNLGIAHPAARYWPVLLIGLGLARLVSPWRGSFLGAGLLLLGTVLLLRNLGVVHGPLGRFWPLLLVAVGIGMVRGAILGRFGPLGGRRCRRFRPGGFGPLPGPMAGPGGPATGSTGPGSSSPPASASYLAARLEPEAMLDAFTQRCGLASPSLPLYY
jgi:hypothetical protein